MLVKEADSTLHRDRVHPKLAHDHFTGRREIVNVIRQGLSFTVRLKGRQIRQRSVAASDIKPFHVRPEHLRHSFEDEFAHVIWSVDLGLADTSVVAVPLYTSIEKRVVKGRGESNTAWAWEYRGRYQDGNLCRG